MRDAGHPGRPDVTLRLGDPVEHPFGYPVFVKPAGSGSSVGISKVRARRASSKPAVALARRHDEKVLVEEFVRTAIEVEVRRPREPAEPGRVASPARSSRTSPTGTTTPSKYDEGGIGSRRSAARPRRDGADRAGAELAVDAFVATDCEGMARVDFFVREPDGEVVDERAEHDPRLHRDELLREALRRVRRSTYAELLDRLIELALERHERRRSLEF